MHIDVVPNRNSKPAYLLRESYREGDKVRKRTLAHLSALPIEQIERIRQILRGEQLAPVDTLFESVGSAHHGHVQAVLSAMKRLGFDALLSSRPCRERDLVIAMGAARILQPHSKLATTRWWRWATTATGGKESCRSTTGCWQARAAARSPCPFTTAIPGIRRRCWSRSPRSGMPSGSRTWSWWAIGGGSRRSSST